MIEGDNLRKDMYLVFGKTELKHFVFDHIHPAYQHVYVMFKSRGGSMWQIINPRSSHIEYDVVPTTICPTVDAYAKSGSIILPVKVDIQADKLIHRLNVFSCVDVVKGVLGVRDWTCFTPLQLYNRIRKGRYRHIEQLSDARLVIYGGYYEYGQNCSEEGSTSSGNGKQTTANRATAATKTESTSGS